MSRKLASVQIVKDVTPIDGADRIELIHVLGWQCVAKKGEFKVGDKCVYFEIDSFLPVREEFEFLRSSSFKTNELLGEGFRIKTQKMRGQISQGLCVPVSALLDDPEKFPEGCDVTELLGVKKWEMPEMATTGGTTIGRLPYDVPHTDETRVQAEPDLIHEFAGLEYYISTKMDGSSHSVSLDEFGFHVTGHNYEYKDDGKSSFYEFIKKIELEEKMRQFAENHGLKEFTLQGEYCGPGIQRNRLKLQKPEWYVFTVRENGRRMGLSNLLEICDKLGLQHVPIEEVGTDLPLKYSTVEALLDRADGEYPNGGRKEGIVIRPTEPVYSALLGTDLSMKVVSNKYLLKNE